MTAQLTAYRSAVGGPPRTIALDRPSARIHAGPMWSLVDSVDRTVTTFKTAGRHPWRCRRTDRSRRAPAISNWASGLKHRRLHSQLSGRHANGHSDGVVDGVANERGFPRLLPLRGRPDSNPQEPHLRNAFDSATR